MLETGDIVWQVPGATPSYGSFSAGELGGITQIVGHDAASLGDWDVATGRKLWTVKPDVEGDFNVPTPIIHNGHVIVATENNGTRRYAFSSDGRIDPEPVGENLKLRPDMSTPVVVGERLFCVKDFLYCLDVDAIKERWRLRDRALGDYAAIIASDERLLVVGDGELLLLKTDGDQQIVSRQRVFEEALTLYSHPALVGNRLNIRGTSSLKCLEL